VDGVDIWIGRWNVREVVALLADVYDLNIWPLKL
jgi:hypothetical protein